MAKFCQSGSSRNREICIFFTAAIGKIMIFWNVLLCDLLDGYLNCGVNFFNLKMAVVGVHLSKLHAVTLQR